MINHDVSNLTLATVATVNFSAAGIRSAVESFVAHASPVLSALAIILQIAIGAITLYHLVKNTKKASPSDEK